MEKAREEITEEDRLREFFANEKIDAKRKAKFEAEARKAIQKSPAKPKPAAAVDRSKTTEEIIAAFKSKLSINSEEDARKHEADARNWSWKNDILPRVKDAGYPERFWREITEWGNSEQETTFNTCTELCTGVGAIVAMTGVRGAGKTTIAAQLTIRRAWNEALPPWERQPPYRKLASIIARFKSLYSDFGSVNAEALMHARDVLCNSCSLLVIDEVHDCEELRVKDRLLTDIIDRRYAARKDTILISNQTPAEFEATTNASILSRLSEHGRIIPCEWGSWR